MTGSELELINTLVDLGGTVMITTLLMIFAYRLFCRFGGDFIQAQQEIAKAMGRQAQSLSDMKDTVHEFVSKDSSEHREILLSLQVVGEELKKLSSITIATRSANE